MAALVWSNSLKKGFVRGGSAVVYGLVAATANDTMQLPFSNVESFWASVATISSGVHTLAPTTSPATIDVSSTAPGKITFPGTQTYHVICYGR